MPPPLKFSISCLVYATVAVVVAITFALLWVLLSTLPLVLHSVNWQQEGKNECSQMKVNKNVELRLKILLRFCFLTRELMLGY